MAVLNEIPHTVIGGVAFGAFPNSSATKNGKVLTYVDHLIDYNKTSSGTFRFLQLINRCCKAASLCLEELNSTLSVYFNELAGKFGAATSMFNYARLPGATKNAWAAITDWKNVDRVTTRDSAGRISEIFEGGASWGYAISGLVSCASLKLAADVMELVGSVADLTIASDDWNMASRHLEYLNTNDQANGPLQQRFAETKSEAFWRILKSVTSIASGVLGLLVLAFGGPVLPAAGLLTISLISTIAALSAHFTKVTSQYELVKFHEVHQPEIHLGGMPAH